MIRRIRVGRCAGPVATALALLVCGVSSVEARQTVCSTWKQVYPYRTGSKKSRIKAGKQRAASEAQAELARMLRPSSVAVSDEMQRESSVGGESQEVSTVIRQAWVLPSELQDQTVETRGKGSELELRYCVDEALFLAAQERAEGEHQETVEKHRTLFRQYERSLAQGEGDTRFATRLFFDLEDSVRRLGLESEIYESPLTGERGFFATFLELWADTMRDDQLSAIHYVLRAEKEIENGRLISAHAHVDRALGFAPKNTQALRVQSRIRDLFRERSALLEQAEERAAAGRFSAAKRLIRQAEEIDSEDERSLQDTRDEIEAIRAQYLVYNPTTTLGFNFAVGSLGVDETETLRRFESNVGAQGGNLAGPIFAGMDLTSRIGRMFQFRAGGSFGLGNLEGPNGSVLGNDMFLQYGELSTGFDFRTVRSPRRKVGFQAGAGVAWETVAVKNPFTGSNRESESQTGYYGRIGVEWASLVLFLQHGFGFEEDENSSSTIAWSDELRFGIGFKFSL